MGIISSSVVLASLVVFSSIGMPPDVDTNGDGLASFEELQAAYTDFTEQLFQQIDTNADGYIDGDEMSAAEEAGLIINEDDDA
jgi:hypothetical protein